MPVASALSTISGVVGFPGSDGNRSAGTLFETAILYHLSPNAPTENTAARLTVHERTAPSIRPLPDDVESRIMLPVYISFWSFSVMRLCSAEASFVLWPIIGVAIFWRTSSLTSTGPGMKSFLCISIPPHSA